MIRKQEERWFREWMKKSKSRPFSPYLHKRENRDIQIYRFRGITDSIELIFNTSGDLTISANRDGQMWDLLISFDWYPKKEGSFWVAPYWNTLFWHSKKECYFYFFDMMISWFREQVSSNSLLNFYRMSDGAFWAKIENSIRDEDYFAGGCSVIK